MIGQTFGPYQVLAKLGEGGMGEVYRARDTRLGRDVAIKVLPPDVAHDADRRARFEREARAVAALSHPNILALHDIGTAGDQLFVVTELLDGETLSDRLRGGALPVRRAVEIATAIARGLAAAHGKGIAHRDLKPANVFLLADGQVKILDFGLARKIATAAASGETETQAALTDPGKVLGTAGYMAPEQIRGQQVDGRADLFALGVVLYEMLTGQRAFSRETTAETLAAILKDEPAELTATRTDLPPSLDRIVRHCLEKSPTLRFQSAQDVVFALETLSGSSPVAGTVTQARGPRNRQTLWWAAATVAALVGGAAVGLWLSPAPAGDTRPLRFDVAGGSPWMLAAPAVSPDGRAIAFVSVTGDDEGKLLVHTFDDGRSHEVMGTLRAMRPAWSPDSKWIAFFMDGGLYKAALGGSPPVRVCDVGRFGPDGASVTWGQKDLLIFSSNMTGAVQVVNAAGGPARDLTTVDRAQQETGHQWPAFLPDGERFVYSVSKQGAATRTLMLASTQPGFTPQRVMEVETHAIPVTGHLLHVANRTLLAQPIDDDTLALGGKPVVVTADISVADNGKSFHASGNIVVAMRANRKASLGWFERSGLPGQTIHLPGAPMGPDIAPDGRRAAIDIEGEKGFREVWLLDDERHTRVTFGGQHDSDVVWSPDGRRLAMAYDNGRAIQVLTIGESATRPLAQFNDVPDSAYPTDWSRDNRYIAYSSWVSGGNPGLWLFPLGTGGPPVAVSDTPFHEGQGRFSPDSRLIAYSINSSGRPEVVIEALPPAKGRWPVSTMGGAQPMWRADGRELFYLALDGTMMVVPMTLGETPVMGQPRPLFKTAIEDSLFYAVRNHYAVTPDGQRFLINQVRGGYVMEVTLNWPALVKQ